MKKNTLLLSIKAFQKSRNPLIAYLVKSISKELLLKMGNQFLLNTGIDFYKENRVSGLSWNTDTKTLRCDIISNDIYSVRIKEQNKELSLSCDCSSNETCKHQICALITLKGVLSIEPVFGHILDPEYQHSRLKELKEITGTKLNKTSIKPLSYKYSPALILENDDKNALSIIYFSGLNLPENDIPKPYIPMLDNQTENQEQLFLDYLKNVKEPLALYWKTDKDHIKVTWSTEQITGVAKTIFEVKPSQAIIYEGLLQSNQHVKPVVSLGKHFVIDPSHNQILEATPSKSWQLFKAIYQENEVSKFSHADFNQLMLTGQEGNHTTLSQDASFIEEGTLIETLPENHPTISIQCKKQSSDTTLKICADKSTPTHLLESVHYLINSLPGRLKTRKHKDQTYIRISKLLNEEPLEGKNAEEFDELKSIIEIENQPIVSIKKKSFSLTRSGLKTMWLTCMVIQQILDIPLETIIETGQIKVSNHSLKNRLPYLIEALEVLGVRLSFNSKLVEIVPLDISLSTKTSESLDWFEIHPELMVNEKSLSEKIKQKILQGQNQWETENSVQVLSIEAMETMKIIQQLESKAHSKKEHIQLDRLQIFDWLDLQKHGVKLRLDSQTQSIVDRLENFKQIPATPLPQKLQATPRSYQKEGYDWLAFLYAHRFGACLADEMGLGKTLQAISLLAGIREKAVASPYTFSTHTPHLIVLPPTLMFNWETELNRFYPDFTIESYGGKNRKINPNVDIVLISYDTLRNDIKRLKKESFHVIIFDEAQTIKNLQSARTSAARELNGRFKLVLTGTPLENHLGEYYSIIDLALPGLLGTYADFQTAIQSEVFEPILKKTRLFVLRRKKEEVLDTLPEKIESNIKLDLSNDQRVYYSRMVQEVRETINKAFDNHAKAQAGITALAAILRLRQICICPSSIDPAYTNTSPKVAFLGIQLCELIEENNSALVFSQFRNGLDRVEEELIKNKIPYFRIDGKTPQAKRKVYIDEFQNSTTPQVFLISLKTGGVGLNLSKANYVYHLDPWWNPAVENQASDRAHRIGQNKKVFVTRLIMRHSIEEKMMKLKERKSKLFNAIMDGTVHQKTAITREDFNFLLS